MVSFSKDKEKVRREQQNNLIVQSLKEGLSEQDLVEAFRKYGEVTSTAIRSHRFKKSSKYGQNLSMGYAFIRFKDYI